MRIERAEPGPGQQSVWDYPRPPELEPCARRIQIVFGGITIVDTIRAQRVLETSHPPVYCVPRDDVRTEHLRSAPGTSLCEWKGTAEYFDVVVGPRSAPRAAWSYPDPTPPFAPIRGHISFYAGPMDACTVDGERVTPQPGGFYGGWITRDVVGPFKGAPGSWGW
ncbi:MAG TPA: DUF427 domain-containing protein [Vicinamibacteria bacterium]|nr:DUF427 domain-containing protein [Vicinamibacteria bacterium]